MDNIEPLYLTEEEIAKRLGMSHTTWYRKRRRLEKAGFPPQEPLFANRRYWPACKAFLDRRHNLTEDSVRRSGPSAESMETWD